MGRFATDEDEAAAIAKDLLRFRATDFEAPPRNRAVQPAMAVLCRRRAQMECLRKEFEATGIPYEIVGLGGLLDTPEIVDLVSTLRVLADPGRSDSLMRLLAGARWRIGPADLMAFRDWSAFLARRRGMADNGRGPVLQRSVRRARICSRRRRHRGRPHRRRQPRRSPGLAAQGGLDVRARPKPDAACPGAAARLGTELRQLRALMGDDLTTLLGEVERAMLLDIEVAARPGFSIHQARRNLDAFQDAAAGFLQTSHRVDVLAFLSWLEAAAAEEGGLDVPPADVNHEAVQLLTVHASKGLEWDVVFVPGLNSGRVPQQP